MDALKPYQSHLAGLLPEGSLDNTTLSDDANKAMPTSHAFMFMILLLALGAIFTAQIGISLFITNPLTPPLVLQALRVEPSSSRHDGNGSLSSQRPSQASQIFEIVYDTLLAPGAWTRIIKAMIQELYSILVQAALQSLPIPMMKQLAILLVSGLRMHTTHMRISKQAIPLRFLVWPDTRLLEPTAFLCVVDYVADSMSNKASTQIWNVFKEDGERIVDVVMRWVVSKLIRLLVGMPAYAALLCTEASILPPDEGTEGRQMSADGVPVADERPTVEGLQAQSTGYWSLLELCMRRTIGRLLALHLFGEILTPAFWFVSGLILLFISGQGERIGTEGVADTLP